LSQIHINLDEQTYSKLVNEEFLSNVASDKAKIDDHQELVRARWILWIRKDLTPFDALRKYSVKKSIVEKLVGETAETPKPKERRSDKYKKVDQWCRENHLRQVNASEIAELGGFSYPTALKIIKDRPDLFYRLRRNLYEVRNPEIIRQLEAAQKA
jgi:hypothetical protein